MLRWLLPGRIDGLLLLVAVPSIWLGLVPWFLGFMDARTRDSESLVASVGVAIGCTLAGMHLFDLYLLFGRGSLLRRFVFATALTAVPLLLLAVNFSFVSARTSRIDPEVFRMDRVLYTVLCQRWVIGSGLACIAMPLRGLMRWRVGPDFDSATKGDRESIAQLLWLMAITAVGIVSARFVVESSPDEPGGTIGRMWSSIMFVELWNPVAMVKHAAGLELLSLVAYVLVPAAVSTFFRNGKMVRLLEWIGGFAWLAVGCGVLHSRFAGYSMVLTELGPIIVSAHVGYAFALGGVVLLSTRYWLPGGESPVGNDSRSSNPMGFALLGLLALVSCLFAYRYDIPTLICASAEYRLDAARTVATVTRALEQPPTLYPSPPFQHDEVRWNAEDGTRKVQFGVWDYSSGINPYEEFRVYAKHHARPALVRAIARAKPKIKRLVFEARDANSLETLTHLPAVETLRLTVGHMDHAAFDRVLESTLVDHLTIWSAESEIDARCLKSLCRQQETMKSLSLSEFDKTVSLNPETMSLLDRLPLEEISVSYVAAELADFGSWTHLKRLSICNSVVNERVLSTLGSLDSLRLDDTILSADAIGPLENRAQLKLHLFNIRTSAETLRRLAGSKIPTIEIINPETPIDLTAAMSLADCPDKNIILEASNIDSKFATRFNVRIGREVCRVAEDLAARISAFDVAGKSKLRELAHEIEFDEQGEVVAADLQWFQFDEDAALEVWKFKPLQRLRIRGHAIGEGVSQLKKLESLEIPHDWLPDSRLRHIGKLTNLRRLQLPMFPFCSYHENPRLLRPEQIPFPSSELEMDGEMGYQTAISTGVFHFDASAEVSYGPGDGDDPMSASGINELRALQKLEYLWMPGPLLHEDSIETIESFPRLRDLHALFTAVDPTILERIAKLTKLRNLSIGVARLNEETLALIQNLQHLELLQLFVAQPWDDDGEYSREDMEKRLRELLPSTEVYLILQENLQWLVP